MCALPIAEQVVLHIVKPIQDVILEVILDKESSLFSSNNLYCKNVDFYKLAAFQMSLARL